MSDKNSDLEVNGRMLSDRYNPNDVEKRIYSWWEENNYFRSEDVSTKPPYCIILPPPNVTGALHMGHALDHTIQDVLIRWKRMSGYNTLWLPGTDHAGIATQSVVEKKLAKEKITRRQLGREKFVDEIWKWKKQFGGQIVSQMKRLGDSCDWDRQVFTLDEGVSKSVRKVFVDLYNKGIIYKGTRLINWSPKLESALSDLEVEHKEVKGNLWHIKYKLEETDQVVIVATTRPETLLGDSALCVHPDDERYKKLIGKNVLLPLTQRKIKIIADEYVDKTFGSGALKITPAHDFNDYEIGKKHELEFINILNKDGTLNEAAGKYKGLTVKDARTQIVGDLEEQGLLEKVEPHIHSVGHCERSGCVVEPFLSDQWFVNTSEISVPAKRVVESGTLKFEPESWTKTYLHWMNKIQDWCISRQLWWGHRIPAWECEDCHKIMVAEETPEKCTECQSKKLVQEEDVLDTWFSSGLWPFSTMGWPKDTETLKTFYPTNVLVTGHDIIFFWVARMIMMGLEFKQDVPFRTVYIHGLVRDSQGRKLSKSLNNAIDPVGIIEDVGADALRFTLMSQVAMGRDLKFSMQRLEGYRNFMNKIWNATRFSLSGIEGVDLSGVDENTTLSRADLSYADQWIIYKIGKYEKEINTYLNDFKFSEAANAVYSLSWGEFCDWYLEFIKPIIYGDNADEKRSTSIVLAQVLNRLIRLLHPFVPFITEEIYQKLPIKSEALIIAQYPNVNIDEAWLEMGNKEIAFELDVVREVITAVRNIRGENRIKPSEKIKAYLAPKDDRSQKILGENKTSIIRMAGLSECLVEQPESLSKCAIAPVISESVQIEVIVPLEGLVDFAEEIKRLNKNIDKLEKEQFSLQKRLGNEKFIANAPEDVVIQGKEQLKNLQIQVDTLKESLMRFR